MEVQGRAGREVFEGSGSRILSPVKRIYLVKRLSVSLNYIIPALEDLVRRSDDAQNPSKKTEVVKLSGEMVARIGVARERYVRELSQMSASETRLKRASRARYREVRMVQ